MEPDSIGKIVFLVILIVFSAYFSATETAFSTLNRIRLKNAADNGSVFHLVRQIQGTERSANIVTGIIKNTITHTRNADIALAIRFFIDLSPCYII